MENEITENEIRASLRQENLMIVVKVTGIVLGAAAIQIGFFCLFFFG